MRVVAGSVGGRRLKAVPGRGTRPTTDRVKESVFGILGERCLEARVLDLFAGTGALGIEALSRGASSTEFVEKDPAALRVLRENLATTGFANRALVRPADVLVALRRLAREGGPYDLVLLDPPYESGLLCAALECLGREDAPLAPGAVVVAEHSNHEVPPDEVGRLALARREKYGETVVSFYRQVPGARDGSEGEGGPDK